MLEVSPDIRLQSAKFQLTDITDFLVSHWHFDHLQGVKELHSWAKRLDQKLNIYCSLQTKNMIDKELNYIPIQTHVLQALKPFTLKGITITPLPVYHMHDEDDEAPEHSLNNVFGYIFEYNGRRVAYLADYYRVPEATIAAIQGVDILIADGTYLGTDEYKGIKHNHLHGNDIVNFTKRINAKEVFYFSISHTSRKSHEDLQQELPSSHFVAYDGMVLTERR